MGLLDQLSTGLLGGTDPTAQLGLSLLAANQPSPYKMPFGTIMGQGVMGAQRQQLELQKAKILQMQALQQQQEMAAFQQIQDELARRQQGAAPSPAPQIGPPQAAPASMQASNPQAQQTVPQFAGQQASQAPQPQRARNPYDPYSQEEILSTPVPNALPVDVQQRILALQHQDPSAAGEKYAALQRQFALQQTAPTLAKLDNVIKSPYTDKYLKSDSALLAKWQEIAPQLGINTQDPTTLTAANARNVLGIVRNQLGASVGAPSTEVPQEEQTIPIGLGGSIQKDYLGNIKGGAPQQETAQFITPDGIKLMTKAAGMAQGLQPYNAATYVNQNAADDVASQIAAYKLPPLTAQAMRTQQGYETMARVKQLNPDYDATQYVTKNKARTAFATGKQGDIVRSLSVATDHLDQLATAADALKNGNIKLANTIANAFAVQTGNPAVTNFDAMKEIVGDEVVKAVVGSTGASGDREQIKKDMNSASSPAQIQGVINKYKGLMGGQLRGLRQQYERTTGLHDFDSALSTQAKTELGGPVAGGIPAGWTVTPHQ